MTEEVTKTIDSVLHTSELDPVKKVYEIAKMLRECDDIYPPLWYAILDMKDKYMGL